MEKWRENLPEAYQYLLAYCESTDTGSDAASLVQQLAFWLDNLLVDDDGPVVPWSQDITNELAHNDNCPGLLKDGWWQRRVDQIDYVTIHHTYGWNSPHAFAKSYIHKEGGRPSVPYTIWVTETGEVLLCNALTEGCWHDHTGHENTHLSIGMAGALHKYAPADVQIDATVKVCAWVINNPDIPLVNGIDRIKGHIDWTSTACPGWLGTGEGAPSGLWKPRFYARLEELLNG